MGRLKRRLRLSTSDTRPLVPMKGSRSRAVRPCVTQRIAREFTRIVQEHDALCKAAPAERGRYLAIEQRLLRVIQHITLRDMLERLIPPGKP